MPNTNPLTVTEGDFHRQDRGWPPSHALRFCVLYRRHPGERFRIYLSSNAHQVVQACVFIGSSTGALLVEDDESLRRIFQVIRRRAAFHAEDEYRLNERKPPDRGRPALASGVARRDRGADGDAAAGQSCARNGKAHPRPAHLDQAGDRNICATTRMSRPARRRRITSPWPRLNATSGSAPLRR